MVMRYFLAVILLFLSSCSSNCADDDGFVFPWKRKKGYTICDNGTVYKRLVYNIQTLAYKYKKERRLKLLDSNIWYDKSLQKIRLDFSTMELLDFCEARFLLVDLVEDLIAGLKKDDPLMAGLDQQKIDASIIEIYIDFKCYFGKYIDYDYVGWISLENGCANYYAFDMRTKSVDWWNRRSESYRESKAVVHATREAAKEWEDAHQPEPSLIEEERFRL